MPFFYEFFAGGGMARAGLGEDWTCSFANDFSAKKAEAYIANWGGEHLHVADINSLSSTQLPGQADLAWASFPCQDLSLAGNGAGLQGRRSGSFWGFMQLIGELAESGRKPGMLVIENVYGTLTSHEGKDFEAIANALAAAGYLFGALVIDAVQFVPQSRPRLFILCVDQNWQIPAELVGQRPSPAWHPEKLIACHNNLTKQTQRQWRWWKLAEPATPMHTLDDIIETEPSGVSWHSAAQTQTLLEMMSPLNRQKVIAAQQLGRLQVGTIYKRTRNNVQRAEVRFDGIAGCLRTPSGGSSRQTIMTVDGQSIRSRLISPREAARLMGLADSYRLPERYNEAYHLLGDGVVVAVVAHLNQHLLLPLQRAQQQPLAQAL
ncbi:DNA cytosine methyltransferase [Pseudomonas sp.]|uniref:DNA cytosine methyltransferase n=1 Tax=Pseudomonas sp. TaxID=306 RepID=UPI003C74E1F3